MVLWCHVQLCVIFIDHLLRLYQVHPSMCWHQSPTWLGISSVYLKPIPPSKAIAPLWPSKPALVVLIVRSGCFGVELPQYKSCWSSTWSRLNDTASAYLIMPHLHTRARLRSFPACSCLQRLCHHPPCCTPVTLELQFLQSAELKSRGTVYSYVREQNLQGITMYLFSSPSRHHGHTRDCLSSYWRSAATRLARLAQWPNSTLAYNYIIINNKWIKIIRIKQKYDK